MLTGAVRPGALAGSTDIGEAVGLGQVQNAALLACDDLHISGGKFRRTTFANATPANTVAVSNEKVYPLDGNQRTPIAHPSVITVCQSEGNSM